VQASPEELNRWLGREVSDPFLNSRLVILPVLMSLDSPEIVAETRDTSGWHSADPALILVPPHYGLRYGFASATGDFQRLRGRPPLVSPLKSCMRRSFTAVAHLTTAGVPT